MPTYLYERKLLNEPTVNKRLTDIYYGYAEPQSVSFEFSNADGYFSTLISTEEIRGRTIRLRRHEPLEQPPITFELSGVITEFAISANDVFSVNVSINDPDPLQTDIARKVLETSDWSWGVTPTALIYLPTQDLGKSYPLCFGYCRKVPLLYVKANHTTGQKAFDYIVSYGEVEDILTVYRNKKVINMGAEGVTFNKGDSNSPYSLVLNGQTVYFAYVRFPLEQRDTSNNMYEISADVKGMKLGTANMQKNFAHIIKAVLNNQAWGLNLQVDDATFTSAATQVQTDFPECVDYTTNLDGGCSGNISNPVKAYDLINELLFACKGKLDINSEGKRTLLIDAYQPIVQATFGENDGFYNNCEFLSISRTPTNSAIKNINIEYGYDNWSSKYAHKNIRNCRTFGEDKTFEFLLVRDHTTADRISSYLKGIELHDTKIAILAGMEAREMQERNVIRAVNARWLIDGNYQIRGIEKGINEFNLELSSYSPSIYTYTVGNLPAEAYNDTPDFLPDYSNTPPDAPSSFQKVTDGTYQSTDGTTMSFIVLSAVIPAVNAVKVLFGYKRTSDVSYTILEGEAYSGSTWRGRIDGLVPGIAYDYIAYAENSFSKRSAGVTLTNQTAVGDTTPPAQVTGLTGRGKYKTWEFEWTANSEKDLRGYRVQIGLSGFGTIYFDKIVGQNKVSYTDDARGYGTLYCRVKAVDFTGNESASWSATATATTSATSTNDLDNNSVTVPVHAFTAAAVQIPMATPTTVQSANITVSGSPVRIDAGVLLSVDALTWSKGLIRVKRGSTTLLTTDWDLNDADGARQKTYYIPYQDQPSAGTYTYSIEVSVTAFAGSINCSNRSLGLMEVKR